MKILILSFIIPISILISCRPRVVDKIPLREKVSTDSIFANSKKLDSIKKSESIIKMTLAKRMIDERLEYIEQQETGKISKNEFDKSVQPIKLKLDSLYDTMSKDQFKDIEEYLQKTGETMLNGLPKAKEPTYPMVKADSYLIGSAERAFAEFMISWQKKDWGKMMKFTQKTWKSSQTNPPEMLEAWYSYRDLLGVKINNKISVSNVTEDITATIYYTFGSEIKTKIITARIIREVAPFKPSTNGEWGVNPTSTLAEK
jgi:hypothetical protein